MLKLWPYFESPTSKEQIVLLYTSINKKAIILFLENASVIIYLVIWSHVTYKNSAQCCKTSKYISS